MVFQLKSLDPNWVQYVTQNLVPLFGFLLDKYYSFQFTITQYKHTTGPTTGKQCCTHNVHLEDKKKIL